MTTKPLLLLLVAALTLGCCITSLHAVPRQRCFCIRTILHPIPLRVIKKIEMIPISGHCRRTEVIVTRKNNSKVCVDPKVKWVEKLLSELQRETQTSSSSTVSPTPSNVAMYQHLA